MVYLCHARIPDYVMKPAAVEAANPFKDEKKSVAGSCTESDRCEEEENSEEEDDVAENPAALRVTTRANIPYDMDRYQRKAMLIMNRMPKTKRNSPIVGHPSSAATLATDRTYYDIRDKMIRVTRVFANFGFEITQYENLTEGQIEQKYQDFFQRNFTDYGCVAVVIFKPDGCEIKDSVIVRPWTTNENPTLRGKPKLYINEFSVRVSIRDKFVPYDEVPITIPDALCLHIPSFFCSYNPQPLHILCDKLTTMPHDHLMAIIKATIEESKKRFPVFPYVTSTQERNLFLSSNTNVEHS